MLKLGLHEFGTRPPLLWLHSYPARCPEQSRVHWLPRKVNSSSCSSWVFRRPWQCARWLKPRGRSQLMLRRYFLLQRSATNSLARMSAYLPRSHDPLTGRSRSPARLHVLYGTGKPLGCSGIGLDRPRGQSRPGGHCVFADEFSATTIWLSACFLIFMTSGHALLLVGSSLSVANTKFTSSVVSLSSMSRSM